jgi:hypothetical protein
MARIPIDVRSSKRREQLLDYASTMAVVLAPEDWGE